MDHFESQLLQDIISWYLAFCKWLIRVKVTSAWMRGPKDSQQQKINVTHFPWQRFKCCGWSVKIDIHFTRLLFFSGSSTNEVVVVWFLASPVCISECPGATSRIQKIAVPSVYECVFGAWKYHGKALYHFRVVGTWPDSLFHQGMNVNGWMRHVIKVLWVDRRLGKRQSIYWSIHIGVAHILISEQPTYFNLDNYQSSLSTLQSVLLLV